MIEVLKNLYLSSNADHIYDMTIVLDVTLIHDPG